MACRASKGEKTGAEVSGFNGDSFLFIQSLRKALYLIVLAIFRDPTHPLEISLALFLSTMETNLFLILFLKIYNNLRIKLHAPILNNQFFWKKCSDHVERYCKPTFQSLVSVVTCTISCRLVIGHVIVNRQV